MKASRRCLSGWPAAILACALAATLGCAGPASAAPGLTPLGSAQIGLHATQETAGAVVVHRGEVYATVEARANRRTSLRVERFDSAREAWLPVGGSLNRVDSQIRRSALLATSSGELYTAWVEDDSASSSPRVTVARLTPDGAGWERVMEGLAQDAVVRLAEVGDDVWVGWQQRSRIGMARITAGRAQMLPAVALAPGAQLEDLVGYHDAAYVAYTQQVGVPPHWNGDLAQESADRWRIRLRVARLSPIDETAAVRVTDLGAWDRGFGALLTAGGPGAPARPILGWSTDRGLQLARLRTDGAGFDPIQLPRPIALRRLPVLRGLAETPLGIALAAYGESDHRVRVYTITGPVGEPESTEGEELPDAGASAVVSMAPAPAPASDGALVLAYGSDARRALAMRYSP